MLYPKASRLGNQSRRRKTLNLNQLYLTKNWPCPTEWLDKYMPIIIIKKKYSFFCAGDNNFRGYCFESNNFLFIKTSSIDIFQTSNVLKATRNYLIKKCLHQSSLFQKWKWVHHNLIYDFLPLKWWKWKCLFNV